MEACAQCTVRDEAICRSLEGREVEELARLGRQQRLAPGQVLQWEGDESSLVGNVIEGVLKLSIAGREGREQTVGLAYPGDFIGRPFGPRANYSVTALSDARVCTFRRTEFETFARHRQGIEHDLLERALGDLDHARCWMVSLGQKSAGARVASFILEMAERASRGGHVRAFDLPLGRQGIADALGLTIETVSRQFTHLRNQGIIATPSSRGVVILDREGLEAAGDCE